MPVALVNRPGQRNEFAEFKTVLCDARDQILQPVDAEAMAQELVKSGGREFVEMVRELTASLANAKRDLESANRRYERLVANLASRGIVLGESPADHEKGAMPPPSRTAAEPSDGLSEWEDWNRKFQSLLD